MTKEMYETAQQLCVEMKKFGGGEWEAVETCKKEGIYTPIIRHVASGIAVYVRVNAREKKYQSNMDWHETPMPEFFDLVGRYAERVSSVNTSFERGVAGLAKDITVRLLPKIMPIFDKAVVEYHQIMDDRELKNNSANAVIATLNDFGIGGEVRNHWQHSDDLCIYTTSQFFRDRGSDVRELIVHAGGHVEIKLRVPAEIACKVLKLLAQQVVTK